MGTGDRTTDSEEAQEPPTAMMHRYITRYKEAAGVDQNFKESLLYLMTTTLFAAILGALFAYSLCRMVRGDPSPDFLVIYIGMLIGAMVRGVFYMGLTPPSLR